MGMEKNSANMSVPAAALMTAVQQKISETVSPDNLRADSLFGRGKGLAYMRILGLDYGSRTVGVAVSDPLGFTAQGVETIFRREENKLRKTLARIEELAEKYQIETIVLGYPKNMDDSIGARAKKTEEFRDMLARRTGLPVVLWDERLTTMEANEILMESGVPRENRKSVIDKVAAILILRSYLDFVQERQQNAGREDYAAD